MGGAPAPESPDALAARVTANLEAVRGRIDAAARAAGRPPEAVQLVVVTKSVGTDAIRAALAAGARDLGENRGQDLVRKAVELSAPPWPPVWHFIGRLQRNKVRALAAHVACWQSVDREEVAAEIARHAPGARVFVQVNIGGEAQKGGCAPAAAPALVQSCRDLELVVEGLMTVPPAGEDPRPYFRALRAGCDELRLPGCSMGMSGDFEVAIAEGATVVRVGTSVFGPRPGGGDARR